MKDFIVKVKIPVTIGNRKYVAGEPIKNPPADLLEAWEQNDLIFEDAPTEPYQNPKVEQAMVDGGMPGIDNRKKVK